jgi:hypothetical protein
MFYEAKPGWPGFVIVWGETGVEGLPADRTKRQGNRAFLEAVAAGLNDPLRRSNKQSSMSPSVQRHAASTRYRSIKDNMAYYDAIDILFWPDDGFWCFRDELRPEFQRDDSYRVILWNSFEWFSRSGFSRSGGRSE